MAFYPRLALMMVLATAAVQGDPAPPVTAAPLPPDFPNGLRIFSIGHSFHGFVPAMVKEMADAAGIKGTTLVGMSIIGGSKVAWHWAVPDEKNEAKKALAAGKVDVLTTTPIYLPDEGEEEFGGLGLAHNPNLRITVQEFWLPFDQYNPHFYDPPIEKPPDKVDHNAATMASLRAMHQRYFSEMDTFVRDLNQKFGKQAFFVVPVGQAVLALREKVIAGQAPGLKSQADLFTDNLGHPKPPLAIMVSYCHYAVIFHKSPVGLPLPYLFSQSEVLEKDKPALNLLLQQLAWDAVIHHPLSGVTSP
jgi:hypothetical protein